MVFFRVWRTVSALMVSTISHSTSRSASSCSVQPARPSGGWEQAMATKWASLSPSSFLGRRLTCGPEQPLLPPRHSGGAPVPPWHCLSSGLGLYPRPSSPRPLELHRQAAESERGSACTPPPRPRDTIPFSSACSSPLSLTRYFLAGILILPTSPCLLTYTHNFTTSYVSIQSCWTTKLKPRWDVHLAGSFPGMLQPWIAGLSGSAVSPRLCGG